MVYIHTDDTGSISLNGYTVSTHTVDFTFYTGRIRDYNCKHDVTSDV